MKQASFFFSLLLAGGFFLSAPSAARGQESAAPALPQLALSPLEGNNLALIDGYASPLLNPAALAFGRASGAALEQSWNSRGLLDNQLLALNSPNTALVLRRQGSSWAPSLSLAAADRPPREAPQLYTGLSLHSRDFQFSETQLLGSLLYRPHPALSAAAAGSLTNRETWNLRGSLALRPLAFLLPEHPAGTVLAAAADMAYSRENGWSSPLLGLSLKPLPPLSLGLQWNPQADRISGRMLLSWNHLTAAASAQTSLEGRSGLQWSPQAAEALSPAPRIRTLALPEVITGYEPADPPFLFPSDPSRKSLLALLQEIQALAEDPGTAGILIKNPRFSASLAASMELAEELNRFREEGKSVTVYLTNPSTKTYLFAAACADRIYLAPPGTLNLTGLSVSRTYFGRFLNRWGITVKNIRSGPYKTGGSPFSGGSMSADERENIQTYLDDLYQTLLNKAADNRLSASGLEKLIAQGPFITASQALETGLADKLLYEDQLSETLEKEENAPLEESDPKLPGRPVHWRRPGGPPIALIRTSGLIHSGPDSRTSIGARGLTKQLRSIREHEEIRGVLLRINSGGGSALASDLIAHEIAALEEAGKPVVVLMGGAAASGGYYMASPARHIIASPFTLTGSIGVYGLRPDASRLLEEQQIGWNSVQTAENSNYLNPLSPLEPEERKRFQQSIDQIYQRFTQFAAEHRELSPGEIEAAAQARIWTGSQAVEKGLVDELGGYRTALNKLKEILKTDSLILRDYGPEGSPGLFTAQEPLEYLAGSLLPDRAVPEIFREFRRMEEILGQGAQLWTHCPYGAP